MESDDGLELNDEEQRQQQAGRQHRASVGRRVAWATFALIVVGALAGLFGPGPLSWADRTSPSGLVEFDYQRFVRHLADTSLELRMGPDPAQPDVARLWISSDYLGGIDLQQVVPQPDTWTASDDGVVMTFPMNGPARVAVQMEIRPDRIGQLSGALGVPGREPIEFWQFVYP